MSLVEVEAYWYARGSGFCRFLLLDWRFMDDTKRTSRGCRKYLDVWKYLAFVPLAKVPHMSACGCLYYSYDSLLVISDENQ